ncbi:MAG: S16 family serine protease, partial [Acidobacteriota bacterium]
ARQVVAQGKEAVIEIGAKTIPKMLGVPKYRLSRKEEHDEVGLVKGLAVTSNGGDILEAEATVVPGKGKVIITGRLEKGMEESGHAAMSYVRSRMTQLGLKEDHFQSVDVHVHFPDFVRKDGPSAGVTIVTAIASALMGVPVSRDVAMTGEISLRGRVLPIGGLKEKLLAAHRAGLGTVIIPKENRKDLREIPRRVLKLLRLVLVDHVDEVLREALVLDDPEAIFGPPRTVIEFRKGELVIREGEVDRAGLPPPRPPPSEQVIEQPGVS